MKKLYLLVCFFTTPTFSDEINLDTLNFAANTKVADSIINCGVLYESLYGKTEDADKFLGASLFTIGLAGTKRNLKAHNGLEYEIGYAYRKNYYQGFYANKKTSDSTTEIKLHEIIYTKMKCSQYIK